MFAASIDPAITASEYLQDADAFYSRTNGAERSIIITDRILSSNVYDENAPTSDTASSIIGNSKYAFYSISNNAYNPGAAISYIANVILGSSDQSLARTPFNITLDFDNFKSIFANIVNDDSILLNPTFLRAKSQILNCVNTIKNEAPLSSVGVFGLPIIPYQIDGINWTNISSVQLSVIVNKCMSAVEDIFMQVGFLAIDVSVPVLWSTSSGEKLSYTSYVEKVIKGVKDWLTSKGLYKKVYGIIGKEIYTSATPISNPDFISAIAINSNYLDGFIYYTRSIEYWNNFSDTSSNNDDAAVAALSNLVGQNIPGVSTETFNILRDYNASNIGSITAITINNCNIYTSTLGSSDAIQFRKSRGPAVPSWLRNSSIAIKCSLDAKNIRDCAKIAIRSMPAASTVDGSCVYASQYVSESELYSISIRNPCGTRNISTAASTFDSQLDLSNFIEYVSSYQPDILVFNGHSYDEPLWWPTSTDIGQWDILSDNTQYGLGQGKNIIKDCIDAAHTAFSKCIIDINPCAFVTLSNTDYPYSLDCFGRPIVIEESNGIFYKLRSFLNQKFIDLTTAYHKELFALGADGVMWNRSTISDKGDFSRIAIEKFSQQLGYPSASDPEFQAIFPFPATCNSALGKFIFEFYGATGSCVNGEGEAPTIEQLAFEIMPLYDDYNELMQDALIEFMQFCEKLSQSYTYSMQAQVEEIYGSGNKVIIPKIDDDPMYNWKSGLQLESLNFTPVANISSGILRQISQRRILNASEVENTSAVQRPAGSVVEDAGLDVLTNSDGKMMIIRKSPSIWELSNGSGTPGAWLGFDLSNGTNISEDGIVREDGIRGHLGSSVLNYIRMGHVVMFDFLNWSNWREDIGSTSTSDPNNDPSRNDMPFIKNIINNYKSFKVSAGSNSERNQQHSWLAIHYPNRARKYIYIADVFSGEFFTTHSIDLSKYGDTGSLSWDELHWPIFGAYESCIYNGIPASIINDSCLENGDLQGISVVVVPHRNLLSSRSRQNLSSFAGTVIYLEDLYGSQLENLWHSTAKNLSTYEDYIKLYENFGSFIRTEVNSSPVSISVQFDAASSTSSGKYILKNFKVFNDSSSQKMRIFLTNDRAWADARPNTSDKGIFGVYTDRYNDLINVNTALAPFRSIIDYSDDDFYADGGNYPVNGSLYYYSGEPPAGWNHEFKCRISLPSSISIVSASQYNINLKDGSAPVFALPINDTAITTNNIYDFAVLDILYTVNQPSSSSSSSSSSGPCVPVIWNGFGCPDINGDGKVNSADLSLMLSSFGPVTASSQICDLDGDGKVDTADLGLLLGLFNQCVQCPQLNSSSSSSGGITGDANSDGIVSGADLGLMLSCWGSSDPECLRTCDFNRDGKIDGADIGVLLSNWTTNAQSSSSSAVASSSSQASSSSSSTSTSSSSSNQGLAQVDLFSITSTRQQLGPKQPAWWATANTDFQSFNPYATIKQIYEANMDSGVVLHETSLSDVYASESTNCALTPRYEYNPNGYPPGYQFSLNTGDSWLRSPGATFKERFRKGLEDNFNPVKRAEIAYKYRPDIVLLDIHNGDEPFIYNSNVPDTKSSIMIQDTNGLSDYDMIGPFVDRAHELGMKCIAYFKPYFAFLSEQKYPPQLIVNGKKNRADNNLTGNCTIQRTIFSSIFKNFLKACMVEIVTPKHAGGLEFDGVYWDTNLFDEFLDFSNDAQNVFAQYLGYSGYQDEGYISWKVLNFPFPKTSWGASGNPLPSYINAYPDNYFQGVAMHQLINNTSELTSVQRDNIKIYHKVLQNKLYEIIFELSEAVRVASGGNAVFAPAELPSYVDQPHCAVNTDIAQYAQAVKTEFAVEPRSFYRPRTKDEINFTKVNESLYADIQRPSMAMGITINQKLDFSSGNKTALQWNPIRSYFGLDLPVGSSGGANTPTTFNSDEFYAYPTGYPLFMDRGLSREDSIIGYLRGIYQISVKNGNIFDFNTWYGTGWIADQDSFIENPNIIYGDGYYNNPDKGVAPGNFYAFWRKALYHARKIKEQIADAGLVFNSREAYSWAAIHFPAEGRKGIVARLEYRPDLVSTSSKNVQITEKKNAKDQTWGDFYWPIFGAMQAFEDRFIPYTMLMGSQLTRGYLKGIKVIVIPHREWISPADLVVLNQFAAQGGKIVYMDDAFRNSPYPKGRWYSVEDEPVASATFYNYVRQVAGEPDFSGYVTQFEFTTDIYKHKQAGWFKMSEIDSQGKFLVGVHLLNDMSWMDLRKNGGTESSGGERWSQLDPASVSDAGIMDQDLFGWGPDWRSWYSSNFSLPEYLQYDDGKFFYDPDRKNMWGHPLVGYGKYWSANLSMNLPSNFRINKAYKFYVDQENEPNDLGMTRKAITSGSSQAANPMSVNNMAPMPNINSIVGTNVGNIKNFGATGDGSTDDSQAFIDAINSSFETIYVPAGNYKISSSINIHRKINIIGDGVATKILCDIFNRSFAFVVNPDSTSPVTYAYNGTISYNQTGFTLASIAGLSVGSRVIFNVGFDSESDGIPDYIYEATIASIAGNGIVFASGAPYASSKTINKIEYFVNRPVDVVIENLQIDRYNSQSLFNGISGYYVSNLRIRNVSINECCDNSILLRRSTGCSVERCIFRNNGATSGADGANAAIYVARSYDISISNVYSDSSRSGIIYIINSKNRQ